MRNDVHVGRRRVPVAGVAMVAWMASFGNFVATIAGEPLQAELRLLTHNVFGKDDDHCEQRARGFGYTVANATPAYDVVGVTEYYSVPDLGFFTCDSDELLDAIRCTGRYTAAATSRLFYPEAEELTEGEIDGGIGLFTMGTICDFDELEFDQTDIPLQGIILSRVQLPNTTVTLDVYVVHIHSGDADGCDLCCRRQQLAELRGFIAQHSRRSGNPVLVMGDFNISGPPTCCGPAGYEYIVELLGEPRDLWYEANACGQSNCGDPDLACDAAHGACSRIECGSAPTPDVLSCLSNPDDCEALFCDNVQPVPNDCNPGAPTWRGWAGYTWDGCLNNLIGGTDLERIDYIFAVTDPALSSSAYQIELLDSNVVEITAVIDPPPTCLPCVYPNCVGCTVTNPSPFVGNVSDHLGVEATVAVRGRSATYVDRLSTGPKTGTSCDPWTTVNEGATAAPSGHRLLIRSGSYDETLTLSRNVTLQSIGGVVTIGR